MSARSPRASGLFDASETKPDPTLDVPDAILFSEEELAALEDLRAAGRELELAHRQYAQAKERHQRALGTLHRIWSAEGSS